MDAKDRLIEVLLKVNRDVHRKMDEIDAQILALGTKSIAIAESALAAIDQEDPAMEPECVKIRTEILKTRLAMENIRFDADKRKTKRLLSELELKSS